MKIAVYEVAKHEKPYFDTLAKEYKLELVVTKEPLSLQNIQLAIGCQGVTFLGKSYIDRKILERLREMDICFLSTRTIGYDHIDIETAAKLNIIVSNSSYPPYGVAEFTVMLMLLVLRHYKPAMWRQQVNDYALDGLLGGELRHQTVGVVGTGRIGSAVVGILKGFGCRILAYDKVVNEGLENQVEYTTLETLYQESDIITLHMPLMNETRNMINDESIGMMKDSVIIINTARGELVDTEALIEGIESKKIGGLGLDVLAEEHGVYHFNKKTEIFNNKEMAYLRQFPNVILTQHIAFFTEPDIESMVWYALKGLMDMANGGHTQLC